jgi:hypothetical protein
MRRARVSFALFIILGAAAAGAGIAAGCSATGQRYEFGEGGSGASVSPTGTGGRAGVGGAGETATGSTGADGFGGAFSFPDGGFEDVNPDVVMNPCGTGCGPVELCDSEHLGVDDDCDGEVDELCTCIPGQAHACFKGDSSFRGTPGCFDGTERCDEIGTWGPCIGGVHATAPDNCFNNSTVGCHPLQAAPFADVDLKEGTGSFSADAQAGSEVWTVTCPAGVDPCPAVGGMSPSDDFKPLQSGEYSVTYSKRAANGSTQTCTYPLFVGAPGLRVELEWEHDLGGTGVDLDLHMHQPNNTQPWAVGGSPFDCGFANCTARNMNVSWFSDSATPPDPVNWYLDPVESNNTCFFSPRGAGAQWRANGRGCHNPRLDIDNITCSPGATDPDDAEFCAPENINIDYPPLSQWMRIGVHYYSSHSLGYSVHPRIKIFCNGALGADLGPNGFYDPEAPVTFAPSDSSTRYWLVADVAFVDGGECGQDGCVVVPLYQDAATKTPLLTTQSFVTSSFGPPYPPLP